MNRTAMVATAGCCLWFLSLGQSLAEDELQIEYVERQPLVANVLRLLDALDYLGHALPGTSTDQLRQQARAADVPGLQRLMDPFVLLGVSINPELRVKVQRGSGPASLQQAGFTPCLIKIINQATHAGNMRIDSPQAGPVYAGEALGTLERQAQTELAGLENASGDARFLSLEMFDQPPMTPRLSGLKVEYAIALIYAADAGQREATLVVDVGQGTQDLGFRSEIPILFAIQPAIPVRLRIVDADGTPTAAKLIIRDADGRIYPPQAKRLAPDLFFQPQVYRHDGQTLLLPPGKFSLTSSRGPEYLEQTQTISVDSGTINQVTVELRRWIDPMQFGYYCGDHHIHGAGCSHYDNPTLGVTPSDMFAQVKGEGLNVGCVLTWGPCFEHQRNYFSPLADDISQPMTVIKYDLEISGFGSAPLGHVCLLNLQTQTYPGSQGSKETGWPTWTVPVMRWAKQQGGITGYPHSALHVDPKSAAEWLLRYYDRDSSGSIDREEGQASLLPDGFEDVDRDGNGQLSLLELQRASDLAADQLPNVALPAMNGGGAMEIFVSTAEGVCDFISAMDTARIPEWNTWYHLMNCGFPLKLSGETDFPCMSSRRVGQGRVYVHLGRVATIDFSEWCRGLGDGKSYVSDGYAHALEFTVENRRPGESTVELNGPGSVRVQASLAFAAIQPQAVAYGTHMPQAGLRMVGDTVNLHAPRELGDVSGGQRNIEVIVNGQVAQSFEIEADGQPHEIMCDVPVERSSWIAIRQFPQLHTNPVLVNVSGQTIRASRSSAVWCIESIKRLWLNRSRFIAQAERADARSAYQRALAAFAQRATECPEDGSVIPPLDLPSP